MQGPVAFNIRVLYKLDSPCHVSECVPFVFNEGTVNVVKLQDVLTVAQNALDSPNLSSMVCSGINPPCKGLLHRICILKILFHALVSWLATVCAAVYIIHFFNGIGYIYGIYYYGM
jgi:hypothetical protein